jgi:hypothetical protein
MGLKKAIEFSYTESCDTSDEERSDDQSQDRGSRYGKQCDPDQPRRGPAAHAGAGAGSSVPGNIAEGARRAGQDRLHHVRIAAGSAGEIRSHLAVAVAWDDVDQTTVAPTLALLDSVLAILWRLTHP